MAQFSMPWEPYVGDGKVYTSAEWRRAWQIMHLPRYSTDGVLYSGGGSDALLPITVGVDTFTIGVGSAMVLGSVYYNDAPVSFSSPSPTVGRIDRIVLQKDWKAGTTRLAYRVGSSATPPALRQVLGSIWEIPLYKLTLPSTVVDERSYANVQARELFAPFYACTGYDSAGDPVVPVRDADGWIAAPNVVTTYHAAITRPIEDIARDFAEFAALYKTMPVIVSLVYKGVYGSSSAENLVMATEYEAIPVGSAPATITAGFDGNPDVPLQGASGFEFTGSVPFSVGAWAYLPDCVYSLSVRRLGTFATDTFSGTIKFVGLQTTFYSAL